MTPSELIAALERAECGSWELSARVWAAVNGWEYLGYSNGGGGSVSVIVRGGKVELYERLPGSLTTSIDAALRLVPSTHDWWLESDGKATAYDRRMCEQDQGLDALPTGKGKAATPALALCIAALKAGARGAG